MLSQALIVVAALLLPIAWGVVVHQAFEFLERKLKRNNQPGDNTYSDYQI